MRQESETLVPNAIIFFTLNSDYSVCTGIFVMPWGSD